MLLFKTCHPTKFLIAMALIFGKSSKAFLAGNRWLGFVILLLFVNAAAIDAQDKLAESSQYNQGEARRTDKLADTDSLSYYQSVKTYVNPVLPGDHPDPTLLKVGDDFYHC